MKFYPTYLQSLGLLLILLLFGILSALAVMPFYSIESGLGISIIYVLMMTMTIITTLFLRRNFKFSWKPFPLGLIFFGSVIILSIHFFLNPVTNLTPSDTLQKIFKEMMQSPVSFFFLIVIAAPILEELLFRGVILDGLLKNYHPYKAIAFSALLFALIHGNFAQGIGAFMIGLLVGWFYWKTESVIPGILIHFINNLIAYVMIRFTKEEDLFKSFSDQLANPVLYWSLVAIGGLVSAGGVWFVFQKYFNENRGLV